MPSFNNNNSLINCISSPLVALIGSILLFHFLLQTQFVVGQWHNGADADAQKWPQNYPGVVVDGNRGVRRRHFPWQEDNNSNNDGWTRGGEKWNNDGSRDGSHYRRNPPSYFPGPARQHAHGNERWENGENMKGYDERGAGGDWQHYGDRDGQEAEDDRESNRSWFDRLLDWIFPWRWGKHSHRKSHDEDVHRRRHHSTSTSSSTTESSSHSTTTMSPSEEQNEEQQFRRRHRTRNETVTARLSGGPIRGLVSYAAGRDRPAYVYLGIPFAEPPLGKLRFAPLRRKRSWKMPVDATKYSPACLSNTTRTRSPQHYISEDCIYVNVFADPKCKETGSKYRGGGGCPVLFYVHGGGFAYDSATMFNDTQIVQKYASDGVIFVIAAYRLGVFGFLDLGNDHTVKRNLGMHDIIFALEWTRREIPTFGGDPDRITIMGNSAGASAVNYLCSSPAVKKEHFQQAIISSGVPFFTADANLEQSFALLDHFDCLRDNATNRTLSDRQKVECLRAVHSLELLREQQHDEQWQVFAGPERDTEILPADNYVELLKYWTPRPLLYSTTTHEFGRFRWMANDSKLVSECIKALTPFGYTSPQSFDTCMARYNDTFDVDVNMRVTYESMHAEAFLTALVNTRLGGISYVGEFELANYSNHADDMYFFFGLHTIPLNTSDVVLMDMYYPKMIKNFLHGHAPDPDWQPQDWNGRNYFRIAFNVSTNGTLLEWPHEVDGYQDVQGLDFWLRQMANVERNARLEALNESSNSSSTWNGTKWSDGGAKTWQDVFGDNAYGTNATHAMRPYHTQLPAVNSLFAMPTYNLLQEDGSNGTTSDIATGQGAVAPGPPGIGAGLLHQLPVVAPVAEFSPEYSQPSTSPLEWESASNELGKVWSAYWLTMTIAVLLAVALVMMAATKMIYRYKNARGYQPTSMDNNTANGGMFTEKTRIIHANGNNGMRYV